MDVKLISNFFSQARFDRYLLACGNDTVEATKLYELNLLLSKCFYPLLSILEVVLRNRLNTIMTVYFKDQDWILNQKAGFMSHQSLGWRYILRNQVEAAERQLIQKHLHLKAQIITELTFAFWVRLFQADHIGLVRSEPKKAFTYLPPATKGAVIHQTLKSVLDFRNRLYHNEPICFGSDIRTKQSIIDLSDVQKVYENFYALLFWLGGNDLCKWVQREIDRNCIIEEAQKVNDLIVRIKKGRPVIISLPS